MLTETQLRRVKSLRAPRKLFDGAGLHLLVTPNGGRYWRYNYRFNGRQKTLSLGVYPEVSLAMARARHQEAKRLFAEGVEPPSFKKQAFGLSQRGSFAGQPSSSVSGAASSVRTFMTKRPSGATSY
jgi:hypothetical protein